MNTLLMLGGLTVLAALSAVAVLFGGAYDISATDQHLSPTYWALDTGMRSAVRVRAQTIDVPPLDDPALAQRGLRHYREHCVQCHGAPGVAPEPFALGMTPAPAALVYTAREWRPAELFWVIKHGIKMTGMPAWAFRMSDGDIWAVVAFMQRMPYLTPAEYSRLGTGETGPAEAHTHGGEPAAAPSVERGRRALEQYACVTCHRIPGIVGANAPVGPPLEGIGSRAVIAGVLRNDPANMVRWLRDPQAVKPGTAMPDLGLSEAHARDIAVFLRTLD